MAVIVIRVKSRNIVLAEHLSVPCLATASIITIESESETETASDTLASDDDKQANSLGWNTNIGWE